MMQLNNTYNRDDFLKFLEENFLTDFKKDIRPASTQGSSSVQKAYSLGRSESLDLQVFEFSFEGSPNKRVSLTKDAFQVMKSSAIFRALAIFHSPDSDDWRLSLMTATPERTERGKVSLFYSNPKRLSFFLGPNAKINTPTKFLINKDKVTNFEDLKNRFSIEVVNKEFYKEISQAFTKLVNGLLKLPSTQDKSQTNLEFAARLIGRIIFCWFLREKKSQTGVALMPKELLSLEAVKKNEDYYHKILEPIFFEVLNKAVKSRRDDFSKEPFSSVPYLNGGLFSPQDDDYYKRTNGDLQSQYHNILVVPDQWFKDFFEILETYNFTIDENLSYDEELSIDPEMLGRIFENLLAEINPDTGESARKSTGSYYTPRTIVNYMIDESLLLYLKERTEIHEKKLRAIISYDLDDDLDNPVTVEEKEKIIDALEKVKILDPACGSGAFPIGALQKIVFILQQTDPEGQLWFKKQIQSTSPEIRRVVEREFSHKNFDYIRKLGIIRENIYGVDIQPIATEISRLRCFLTLIVDERIQDEADNRGIEPLPNLDFKFVTSNSLIGLPKVDLAQQSMFDDYQKIDDLKNVRDQYFNASGLEREQLKTEFVMSQKRLVDQLIKEHGFMGIAKAELTQKLTDWEPFTHKSTSWFDPEWMFGIKDGFDIVIGNPPYVQLQKNSGELARLYEKSGFQTYARTSDLYCLFYERGLSLTKSNTGLLCYITSNKWMRTEYGARLRDYFSNRNPILLIDFGGFKVFESATVDTNILLIQNSSNRKLFKACCFRDDYEKDGSVATYFESNHVLFGEPSKDIWLILSQSQLALKEKLERVGKRLRNWGLNINYGIKTGLNEAFIISESKYEEFISLDPKSSEIIEPVLRGRDIVRYGRKWAGLYLINVHNGFSDSMSKKNPPININDYPAVKRHLDTYLSDLKARDDQGVTPYNLRHCAYVEEFKKEKIMWQEISQENTFYLDIEGFYCNDTARIMSGKNLKYLVAIFNSKLFHYGFKNFYAGGGLGGDGIRYKSTFMENFPIVPTEQVEDIVSSLESLVEDLLKAKKNNNQTESAIIDKKIDEKVYKLYRLTEEEIGIVEGKQATL